MPKTLTLGTLLLVKIKTILPADITSITTPTTSTLVANSGSFVTLGVKAGDIIVVTDKGSDPENGKNIPVQTVVALTLTAVGTPFTVNAVADNSFSIDVYRPISNLTNIGTPGPTKGETEVTDFDSLAREFLATLPDNGELPFSGNMVYTNEGQALMFADANDPNAPSRTFRIDFTRQAVRFDFLAFVKSFRFTAGGVDDAYGYEGSLRITGAVTPSLIP